MTPTRPSENQHRLSDAALFPIRAQEAIGNPGLSLETVAPRLLSQIVNKATVRHPRAKTIYWQGDCADTVYLNLKGTILLTVVSGKGKEGVVEVVSSGEFFGESCVCENPYRVTSAVTLESTTVISLDKLEFRSLLRTSPDCVDEFLRHLALKAAKCQERLSTQIFDSSETRLAKLLVLLARGREDVALPRISQSTLAVIVGTTRSRISQFLVTLRNTGAIEYRNGLHVNMQLLDAMLKGH